MKKRLLLLLTFLGWVITSCDKEAEAPNNPCTSLTLISNNTGLRFDKTIVLYEDADYLIKAPVNLFVSDLYIYLPDYESYLSTVDKIVDDAKLADELTVNTYFPESRINSIIALELESGHCYVYSKKEGLPVEEVCVARFSCPATLAGSFGRKFYLRDKLFLEVVDGNC